MVLWHTDLVRLVSKPADVLRCCIVLRLSTAHYAPQQHCQFRDSVYLPNNQLKQDMMKTKGVCPILQSAVYITESEAFPDHMPVTCR